MTEMFQNTHNLLSYDKGYLQFTVQIPGT